jgi:hypothetical protein
MWPPITESRIASACLAPFSRLRVDLKNGLASLLAFVAFVACALRLCRGRGWSSHRTTNWGVQIGSGSTRSLPHPFLFFISHFTN